MLFRKKAPRVSYRLTIRSEQGAVLYAGPLQDMPMPEACILAMSEQYFHDPKPCEIHRGAVRMRAVAELQQCCPTGTPVAAARLGDDLQRLFADHPGCTVQIDSITEN